MVPLEIELISTDVLTIKWDGGHQGLYFTSEIRKNCPCAICREKNKDDNPLQILPFGGRNPELVSWEMVGRYAVSFKWSDGHGEGIYPFKMLRDLCECDLCRK